MRDGIGGADAGAKASVRPWHAFACAALAAPDSVAVRDEASGREVSYANLWAHATALGESLRPVRAAGTTAVAYLGASAPAEAAFVLATLRAGLAFIPLRYDAPPDAALRRAREVGAGLLAGSAVRLRAWGAATDALPALEIPPVPPAGGVRPPVFRTNAGIPGDPTTPWLVQQHLLNPKRDRAYSVSDVAAMLQHVGLLSPAPTVARWAPLGEPHALLEIVAALGGGRLLAPAPGSTIVGSVGTLSAEGTDLLVLGAHEVDQLASFKPTALNSRTTIVSRDRAPGERTQQRLGHLRLVHVPAPHAPLGDDPRVVVIDDEMVDADLVEETIRTVSGVSDVTVTVTRAGLVAGAPAGSRDRFDLQEVQSALRNLLPHAAVPRRWSFVEPAPDRGDEPVAVSVSAEGGAVRTLTDLWCGVLDLPRLPPDADFFALGGTSRDALRLRTRLREVYPETPLTLRQIYELSRFQEMSAHLAGSGRAGDR